MIKVKKIKSKGKEEKTLTSTLLSDSNSLDNNKTHKLEEHKKRKPPLGFISKKGEFLFVNQKHRKNIKPINVKDKWEKEKAPISTLFSDNNSLDNKKTHELDRYKKRKAPLENKFKRSKLSFIMLYKKDLIKLIAESQEGEEKKTPVSIDKNHFPSNRSVLRHLKKKKINYPVNVKLRKRSLRETLRCLLRFHERYPNGYIYPSQATIGRLTGFSVRTINSDVKELHELGLIKKIYRHRYTCVYLLSNLVKSTKIKFFFMAILPFLNSYSKNFTPIKEYINIINISMGNVQRKSIYEERYHTSKSIESIFLQDKHVSAHYRSVDSPKRARIYENNQKKEELCVVNKKKAQQDIDVYPGCNTYSLFKESIYENRRKMQTKRRYEEEQRVKEEANKQARIRRNKSMRRINEACRQATVNRKNSVPLKQWMKQNNSKNLTTKGANFLKFLNLKDSSAELKEPPEPEPTQNDTRINSGPRSEPRDTNNTD